MYLKTTTLVNIINILKYFENLTVRLHVLYALNTYVKFCNYQILFTILFIRLYFMHNFKLQKLYDKKKKKYKNLQFKQFIDDIAIDL